MRMLYFHIFVLLCVHVYMCKCMIECTGNVTLHSGTCRMTPLVIKSNFNSDNHIIRSMALCERPICCNNLTLGIAEQIHAYNYNGREG